MKININFSGTKEKKPMKEYFAETLEVLGDIPGFVYVDSDLMSALGTKKWAEENPEKAFNAGVAESNMAGICAGLAVSGCRPMMHTFGTFASRRCFDQVFLSIAYNKADVVIIGSDPGVTAAYNGGTHMPFEDVALYRTIPEAVIIDITDSTMLTNILPKMFEIPGVKYLRFGRKEYYKVYENKSEFDIGKGVLIRDGSDVAIIASGIMVPHAVLASKILEREGVDAAVIDMFTIKRPDKEIILRYAEKCGCIVTAENHNVIGGLGSTVAEILSQNYPVPLEMNGVKDLFGEVGPMDYLLERFELRPEDIYRCVKRVLERKVKMKKSDNKLY